MLQCMLNQYSFVVRTSWVAAGLHAGFRACRFLERFSAGRDACRHRGPVQSGELAIRKRLPTLFGFIAKIRDQTSERTNYALGEMVGIPRFTVIRHQPR
jgi:hypothetical protein